MILSPESSDPVVGASASPTPAEFNSPPPGSTMALPAVIHDARFHDLARRVLCHEPREYIARELGLSVGTINTLLTDPKFIDVYVQVRNEFYTELDKNIKDEKLVPAVRAVAQAARAQTMMGEIMQEIRARIQDGRAKATDLKVGAELATAIIDRSPTLDQMKLPAAQKSTPTERPAAVSVNFNMGNSKAIRDVVKESGLDLSDVLDAEVTDAPSS